MIKSLEAYFHNYKDIISQYLCAKGEVLFLVKKELKVRKIGSDAPFRTVFIGGTLEETKAFIDGMLRVHFNYSKSLQP